MNETGTRLNFSVAALVVTSLDALLNAAAAHLGEPLPDGQTAADPSREEAWLSLCACGSLLDRLGPMMHEKVRASFDERFERLRRKFADTEAQP